MKKLALLAATAAAAAMIAPTASAHGYLGASYGNIDANTGEADALQVEGAFGWNNGSWGTQFDASIGQLDGDTADGDSYAIGGHVYWGNENWRIGGVVGTTNVDDGGSDLSETAYGFEGSLNLGDSAVALASTTWGTFDFFGTDIDTWNLDGRINLYSSANFRIGATYGIGNLEAGGFDGDTSTYGVDAEFAPFSAPVSFTVGWLRFEDDDFLGFATDTVSAGVRWNFGGGTLRDRDNAAPFNMRTGYAQRLYDVR